MNIITDATMKRSRKIIQANAKICTSLVYVGETGKTEKHPQTFILIHTKNIEK